MFRNNLKFGVGVSVLAMALTATTAQAAAVDLSTWTREGTGTWVVAPGNNSVLQTVNGNPTVFYSDFNAFGNKLSGTVRVGTSADDDFFGFVVGFTPGDLTDGSSNFLLVDWKQGTQTSFGCSGVSGLAVSSVSAGLGNNAGAWCHTGLGVTQLTRGATLGSTGWVDNTTYTFDLQYTSNNLKVLVDGILQADINGSFSNGRFGFYNYSQASVTYAGITNDLLPPEMPPMAAVPEPATWAMMLGGFGLVGATMRRRRSSGRALLG